MLGIDGGNETGVEAGRREVVGSASISVRYRVFEIVGGNGAGVVAGRREVAGSLVLCAEWSRLPCRRAASCTLLMGQPAVPDHVCELEECGRRGSRGRRLGGLSEDRRVLGTPLRIARTALISVQRTRHQCHPSIHAPIVTSARLMMTSIGVIVIARIDALLIRTPTT